ncbi:FkbM family methyltransferase [Methylorubrum populi]|uniref:FkbM family methyltransferase n=1 Tax=Methylorubrum populi TaxID=223967 RepID=UPI001154E496|nr:FkbM family methyltransferase [Methylorubrum populi]QDI83255.1 FkbM family methyltransferase [Methylorubrum populi]
MRQAVVDVFVDACRRTITERLRAEQQIVGGLHFVAELLNKPHEFQKVRDLMADRHSVSVLDWLLNFRTAHYLTGSKDAAEKLFPPIITRREHDDMMRRMSSLPEAELEGNVDFDLIENFILDGYTLPGVCEVEEGDTVINLGSFNGSTDIVFARMAGETGHVHAFEPNPAMHGIIRRNLEKTGLSNRVSVIPMAVSERPGTLRFATNMGAASQIMANGDVEVPVITLDQWVQQAGIERVDFLKLDIEGHEIPALRGAAQTIVRHRPKLAISVYHYHNDVNGITLLIHELSPWYEFYLRHNAMWDSEVVLFGRPIKRLG